MSFSNLPPTKEKLADTTEKREKRLQLLSFFACVILMHITGIILRALLYEVKEKLFGIYSTNQFEYIMLYDFLTTKTD